MSTLKAFRLPVPLANRLSSLAKATHRSEKYLASDPKEPGKPLSG